MAAHLALEARIGGYEAADAVAADVAAVYDAVGNLIGAPARNVALTENATAAFALALSAFDFAPGDVLLTTRNDYVSNQLMYLSLEARRGLRVVRAEDLPEGGVDPSSVRELVRAHRPRIVALTWVPTNSGLVQPAEDVGAVCAQEGVPYLVDACQAVGQLEVDVGRLRCDFLSATARKFLRGPRGIGFLYVSDAQLRRGASPLYIDMRGAEWVGPDQYRLVDDARRFENWEFAYALVLGLGAAARYAQEVGAAGHDRAWALAAHIRTAVAALPGWRVLDRGANLCAIATAAHDHRDATDLVDDLRELGINTSATTRTSAFIDMTEKGVESSLRISPHYYNTFEEVDTLLAALHSLTS